MGAEGSVGAGIARDGGVAIVTAASRNYFGCLQNLVGSVHVWGGRRDGAGRVQVGGGSGRVGGEGGKVGGSGGRGWERMGGLHPGVLCSRWLRI